MHMLFLLILREGTGTGTCIRGETTKRISDSAGGLGQGQGQGADDDEHQNKAVRALVNTAA